MTENKKNVKNSIIVMLRFKFYLKIPPKTAQINETKLKENPLLNNLWWSTIETTGILKINYVMKIKSKAKAGGSATQHINILS